jgi:hypothetical protein
MFYAQWGYIFSVSRTVFEVIGKAIPVTGREGPYGCETSRLPHFLDNRLTGSCEVVSLTRRSAAIYPPEDSWYSFLLEATSTPGPQCGCKDYVN